MAKHRIIMDVDTGTDDAVALLMAMKSEDIEILGICSVNGNRNVDLTTDNTLRVVDYMGMGDKLKVYRGAPLPMVSTLNHDRRPLIPYGDKEFDGSKNHGNHLDLPETNLKEEKISAVQFYLETLMNAEEPITIVAVGPLTNLGLALRAEPRITDHIKELIIMGGSLEVGNSGPAMRAEFNFWCDPESVEIVFQSGIKQTLVPLDITNKNCIKMNEAQMFEDSGTKAGVAAATFIKRRIDNYQDWDKNNWQRVCDPDEAPIHDALCVAGLLDPTVFTEVVPVHMHMDYSGGTCDGVSLANFKPSTRDLDGKFRPAVKNVNLVMAADRLKFAKIMGDLLMKPENN